ncbi:hypothetical protein [Clostridium acetireducens]|uniref:hypothetical protein n=1 Tax=Clostridium acetireducens TaxID=76489 RepID=UPI00111313F7|nr:hypothetical protein [Clostridium acetireducens]
MNNIIYDIKHVGNNNLAVLFNKQETEGKLIILNSIIAANTIENIKQNIDIYNVLFSNFFLFLIKE